jgi:hypothetical protein
MVYDLIEKMYPGRRYLELFVQSLTTSEGLRILKKIE